jgi:hypothetical protein
LKLNVFNVFENISKNFRQLVKTGAYCQICMNKITNYKIRNLKVKYDITLLIDFCNKNNIILFDDYSDKFINRDSLIEGIVKMIILKIFLLNHLDSYYTFLHFKCRLFLIIIIFIILKNNQ